MYVVLYGHSVCIRFVVVLTLCMYLHDQRSSVILLLC
jgi:hypothetical protein